MKIGIIGASLAGLIAGEKLARAGHDVTVIEKSRKAGGRLVTHKREDGNMFDYGVSHFRAGKKDFRSFVSMLVNEGDLIEWTSSFEFYDGTQLHDLNPNRLTETYYAAPEGMEAIVRKLSRWVDIKSREKAGGLTYIGADRSKKRTWMINLTDISVFECDAVIVATPATPAYGILQTAQDETAVRRIIRHIDEIEYTPECVIMGTYKGQVKPDWQAIESTGDRVGWIINESSKRENSDTCLVIKSSAEFARTCNRDDPERWADQLLRHASDISGEKWIAKPDSVDTHFWKYASCRNPMDEEFMELDMEEAPLALVGDYLAGNTVESAYLSGLRLADYWIRKYEMAEV